MIRAVADAWDNSDVWWKRMLALLMLAAVLIMARTASILFVSRRGTAWIQGAAEVVDPQPIPANYEGARLLVPKTKSKQSMPSWLVMERGRVTGGDPGASPNGGSILQLSHSVDRTRKK